MKLNPNLPDLLCGVYVKNIVECTDTESFLLWKEHEDDNNAYRTQNCGCGVHIGYIKDDQDMPIWISIQLGTYKGVEFLRWESTSRYVDYAAIRDWFNLHFPNAYHTNSMNIHNVK